MCVHYGGDIPRVVGVQQHVAGQVHRHRLTLALALPAYSGKLLVVGVQQHVAGQVHRHRLTLALTLPAYSGKLPLMHGNREKLHLMHGNREKLPLIYIEIGKTYLSYVETGEKLPLILGSITFCKKMYMEKLPLTKF